MRNFKHQPFDKILDRELSLAEIREPVESVSDFLEELCNLASWVLGRCEKSMKGTTGTPSSLIFLYYHVVQMADGIQVLVSRACFDAAVPLLRSLWEATLYLSYMLEKDFEERSTAWLASYYLKRIKFNESLIAEEGKTSALEKMKTRDKFHKSTKLAIPSDDEIKKQIKEWSKLLEKPKFKKVVKKIKNNKSSNKWYSINNGPRTIERLALQLSMPMEYEILYRMLSDISHAEDISRFIDVKDSKIFLAKIRSGKHAEMIFRSTSSYLTIATDLISKKLRDGEDILTEIREIRKRHGIPFGKV